MEIEINLEPRLHKKFGEWFVNVWQPFFVCPECGRGRLDLAVPRLGHPIVCTHCHTLFDLVKVKKEDKEVIE
ncbi:MAG: hypothetical protein AYK18_06990 [Theionarchaea archaeon DG-70]|nr:MAG: hypothetical protein AYK18_06990 [Theionarchaea archaeon DG-70]